MDFNKVEIDALKEISEKFPAVIELTELQLALVGGGSGEVSPY